MIIIVDPHEITTEGLHADHVDGHVGFVRECPNCGGTWKQLKEIQNTMHTGMLWFDNSQNTLQVKLQKGIEYYQKKYGRTPDMVLVHPNMIDENNPVAIKGVTVRPYRPVLPGHIWIGIEDKG
jgi:hypothetical protein